MAQEAEGERTRGMIRRRMSKSAVIGWVISSLGMVLWLYGYFVTGHPSLVDWHSNTPWWIADFLPNLESEIGMALAFGGMVPIYWPRRS